jgi:hypothetical protein
MSTVAQQLRADVAGYGDNWEHLAEELCCVDLRMRLLLHRQPVAPVSDPLALFKGLVISDAEVSHLLAQSPDARSPPAPWSGEQQRLEHAIAKLEERLQTRRAASRQAGMLLSLPRLSELFGLTRFEEACLIIGLAPEIDRKYEKLYGYLQDDATRRAAGVDFVLNLLCAGGPTRLDARAAFDPHATLMRFKLLELQDAGNDGSLLSRSLKLDHRVANFLLGRGEIDGRLARLARMVPLREGASDPITEHDLFHQASRFVQAYFRDPRSVGRNAVLYLNGPEHSDQRPIVEALCRQFALPLLVADVEAMKAGALPFAQAMLLAVREATLQSAVLCLENVDCLLAEPDKHRLELTALTEWAATLSRLTFVFGTKSWRPPRLAREWLFLSIPFGRPDLGTCRRLWEQSLAGCGSIADKIDSVVMAGKFQFGLGQIQAALSAAESLARWRAPENWRITESDLTAACRAQSSPRLGSLAQKIEPKHTWTDIVLPPDNLAQLTELCAQARHRPRVYGDWGFDRKLSLGKGLNALFSGPPGTGKTMAAEVIANELQLDLYRIDLSQVVSKYIGETEKNLHHIFLEAQAAHAILFFDEADALFGKRSEVKDAHDRYANIEVGYLLQKMEEYEGVAILATNLSRHIDDAFLRRMHFIVEFPFPDQEYRRRIWRVVFPHEAPLAEEVDFDLLAHEIKLAGGNIRNIALAAAFYAAGNGETIQMPHLWQAARREHQKLGRTWALEESGRNGASNATETRKT